MDTSWLQDVLDLIAVYALNVMGGIFLLIGGWILSKWVRHGTRKGLGKTTVDPTLVKFFSKLAGWLVMIFAVLASLELFGIQSTSFIAVLGATGLAVGLAFQGTLSNFAAGMLLLLFRPFRVGDVVTAGGSTGRVHEIDLFVTKLDTRDNRRLIVPNSKIVGDTIENITHHPVRRVDVKVGTDYGANLKTVRTVLERAASGLAGRAEDPPPQVFLVELGASSIDWEVRVWCHPDDYFAVREALTEAVKVALDEAGIGIPYPQLDVHLDGAAS